MDDTQQLRRWPQGYFQVLEALGATFLLRLLCASVLQPIPKEPPEKRPRTNRN